VKHVVAEASRQNALALVGGDEAKRFGGNGDDLCRKAKQLGVLIPDRCGYESDLGRNDVREDRHESTELEVSDQRVGPLGELRVEQPPMTEVST
jgi:hypothetical protein